MLLGMARLKILSGPHEHEPFDLPSTSTTIGRAKANEVQLPHRSVSKYHLLIVADGDSNMLFDLDSTNGTFLNNQRISSAPLKHGDHIRLGEFVLEYDNPAAAAVATDDSAALATVLTEAPPAEVAPAEAVVEQPVKSMTIQIQKPTPGPKVVRAAEPAAEAPPAAVAKPAPAPQAPQAPAPPPPAPPAPAAPQRAPQTEPVAAPAPPPASSVPERVAVPAALSDTAKTPPTATPAEPEAKPAPAAGKVISVKPQGSGEGKIQAVPAGDSGEGPTLRAKPSGASGEIRLKPGGPKGGGEIKIKRPTKPRE